MKMTFRDVSTWFAERLGRRGKARPVAHVPRARRLADMEPIEGTVQNALHPVEPPRGFREALRDNLRVAAQQRQTGLRVEYPRPIRQVIWLTVSLGVVVATVTTVLLARRGQERSQP